MHSINEGSSPSRLAVTSERTTVGDFKTNGTALISSYNCSYDYQLQIESKDRSNHRYYVHSYILSPSLMGQKGTVISLPTKMGGEL